MPVFMALIIALLLLPFSVRADQRLGLIIGNDTYDDVPTLQKARADALSVSAALRDQGFEITTLLDGSRRDMNRQISEFTHRLQPGDTAFVFFAGHGVEIDGENYLLPTDIAAPSAGERDFIKSESIALSALLDRVRATGARTTIAVIDACRENPFAVSTGRSIGTARGLGRISAPQGTFVIFSAGAGQLALDRLSEDDTSENSVFTRLFLPRLQTPDLELRSLMAGLRRDVRDLAKTVNHDQFPAYYDELLGQFFFAQAAAATTSAGTPDQEQMRQDFDLARKLGTPAAYDTFLDRYGDQENAFPVQLARQLRGTGDTQPPAGTTPPDTVGITALSPREIIRQTQSRLNALGCGAGPADGVIGRRTRAAFDRFVTASGASVPSGDLGTQAALNAVMKAGTVCPAAQTSQSTEAAARTTSQGTIAPSAPALSLAGTWTYSASCALFITANGRVTIRHIRDNFYQSTITDNLGNKGHGEVYLNGRDITGTEYFPGLTNHFRGRLSPDGQSYSGSGTNTCAVHARRG